jgi:hypothetical protein
MTYGCSTVGEKNKWETKTRKKNTMREEEGKQET